MCFVSKMRSTLPFAVAHDPPEAGRVDPVGGEQGGHGALPVVLLEQSGELLRR